MSLPEKPPFSYFNEEDNMGQNLGRVWKMLGDMGTPHLPHIWWKFGQKRRGDRMVGLV